MEKSCANCRHVNCEVHAEPCNVCIDFNNWELSKSCWESTNPYWERITQMADKQREKGISTYGQGLERNTVPDALKRIEYIQEELIDALMYMEWLKERLEGEK